jgi:hypothetical protein
MGGGAAAPPAPLVPTSMDVEKAGKQIQLLTVCL